MPDTPLHPAIVHFPIGLACVLPLLAIAFSFTSWRAPMARGSRHEIEEDSQ